MLNLKGKNIYDRLPFGGCFALFSENQANFLRLEAFNVKN